MGGEGRQRQKEALTPEQERVERLAVGLYNADTPLFPWCDAHYSCHEMYRRMARAALAEWKKP